MKVTNTGALGKSTSERVFRRLSDHKPVEAVSYLKAMLEETPDAEIYIGCDSQVHGKNITYATVIVLHYRGRGGHVLYNREVATLPKRKRVDKPTSHGKQHEHDVEAMSHRLWHEVELSLEVAEFLLENGVKKAKYIDIDVNPDRKWKSNIVLASAMGLVSWRGFEGRTKPEAVAASRVADKLCK